MSYRNHFYQEEDSYVSKCLENVLVDKIGRLWLSPCSVHAAINSIGLLYFDGYRFLPLDPLDLRNLTNEAMIPRGISRAGNIFGTVGFTSHIFFIDPINRTSHLIRSSHFVDRVVKKIIETRDGSYLMLFDSPKHNTLGLMRLQDSTVTISKEFANPQNLPNGISPYGAPLVDGSDDLWFMSLLLPVYRYDKIRGRYITYGADQFPDDLRLTDLKLPNVDNLKPAMVLDRYHELYLYLPAFYGDRLFRFDREAERFNSIMDQFPADWKAKGLYQDQVGNICFLFEDSAGKYRAILQDIDGARFDLTAAVSPLTNIKELRSQNFFQQLFAVGDDGLYTVSLQQSDAIQSALTGKWISSMMQLPDGQLLVNTVLEGWYMTDPATGQSQTFAGPDCGSATSPFNPGMRQQLQRDEAGNFWFLANERLVRYDPLTERCELFELGQQYTLFTLVDKELVVLSDRSNTLALYHLPTQSIRELGGSIPNQTPAKVRDLMFDRQGNLWIPTNHGLWTVNLREKTSRRVELGGQVNDARFNAIYEAEDGKIWLGTYFDGLVVLDPHTGSTTVINREQGLSNNSVMSIIQDDEEYMWVGTEYGITLLTPDARVVREIHREDGLNYEIFERFDPYKDRDGNLYFGSRNGINIINPGQFRSGLTDSVPPIIYLTELAFYDQGRESDIVRIDGLERPQQLTLAADRRYLRLQFALNSYIEPQRNRYAYKLEGIQDDWVYLGTRHELVLNQLPVGRYRLLIKGGDYLNNWTEEPLAISIHARDFFYKQSWFYLLLAGMLGGLVWIWIRRLRLEKQRLEAEVSKRTRQIRQDKEVIEQQARELQQLDDLKSRFFTNITHELRTPITLITTPVEQLLRKSTEQLGNGTRQSLQMVLNNGRKLLRLVEELLDLSRLEADKMELEETATDISQFCRKCFQRFTAAAEAANIDYQFINNWPPENAATWLDQDRVEKIISNLLANALKFTSAAGSVQFRLQKAGACIQIQVKDTGRGIAPVDLPHIFDRYFQTKMAGSAEEGGTGIGLALARELSVLMQGTLGVESEPGKGSTFVLTLPFKPVAPANTVVPPSGAESITTEISPRLAEAAQPMREKINPGKHQPRLLIVEDNQDMQQLLLSLLAQDYHCLLAANGQDALEQLTGANSGLPALILSDIMMPRMDGYALLENLKGSATIQYIPVIILTSKSGEADKLRALRMGVDDYLTKPFGPEELQLRVQRLITNSRRRTAFLQSDKAEETLPPDANQRWLQQLETKAISALDQQFGLSKSYLAHEMALSERQLLRRLKGLTGLTIHQYILEIKLQRARHLLEKRTYPTLKEVARACGFNSPGYFSRIYEQHFGRRPGR